jgi:hypothetical protein
VGRPHTGLPRAGGFGNGHSGDVRHGWILTQPLMQGISVGGALCGGRIGSAWVRQKGIALA